MQTQTAEKIQYVQTQLITINKEEIEQIDKIFPLCKNCRNLRNYQCKKNLIPRPKFLGGLKCKNFHEKIK